MEQVPQNFKNKGILNWKSINVSAPNSIQHFWRWMNGDSESSDSNFKEIYTKEELDDLKKALDLDEDVELDVTMDSIFSIQDFIDINNESVFGLDFRELYDFFDDYEVYLYVFRDKVGRWSYATEVGTELFKCKMFFEDREHSEIKGFEQCFIELENKLKKEGK